VNTTYFYLKDTRGSDKKAVYIILGINSNGYKDVLGFYVSESESANIG
jgi:putative transposase